MTQKKYFSICFCLMFLLTGCSQVKKIPLAFIETEKVIWGSSTRALEEARADGLKQDYPCSLQDCFEAVLSLARNEPKLEPLYLGPPKHSSPHREQTVTFVNMNSSEETKEEPKEGLKEEELAPEAMSSAGAKKIFDVFLKSRKKGCLVVLGLSGQIETTEVGIFFSKPLKSKDSQITVEVTSLSQRAKEKVAEAVFDELDYRFLTQK